MKIVVDTSGYRDFCDGLPAVVHLIRAAEEISIPFVTLAELRAGFLIGTAGRQKEGAILKSRYKNFSGRTMCAVKVIGRFHAKLAKFAEEGEKAEFVVHFSMLTFRMTARKSFLFGTISEHELNSHRSQKSPWKDGIRWIVNNLMVLRLSLRNFAIFA